MESLTANLSNWRHAPFNTWSFRNVHKIIETAKIEAGPCAPLLKAKPWDTSNLRVECGGRSWTFSQIMAQTETDAVLILHDGKIIYEIYPNSDATARHILFSVSKSLTGILAGILVSQGKLNPDAPVSHYVPEIVGSAYGTATVRHVLDMTVGVGFVEDYLDTTGAFARYRCATAWNPPNPAFNNEGLHQLLTTLPGDGRPHGTAFHYVSPNSDLLGWILERAGESPLPKLLSDLIWRPMGAEFSAYITVDGYDAPRSAGGICCSLRDLARFGEMVRRDGVANGKQIVPQAWIEDIRTQGDFAAWQKGDLVALFPQGRYRSQWYVANEPATTLCAIGIHGQWIYINREAKLVIAKQSSQRDPLQPSMDQLNWAFFEAICEAIAE